MLSEPVLTDRIEQGRRPPMLVWRLASPLRAISSAPFGGGVGLRRWVINATVPMSYRRDDPDAHLAGLAADLGLPGPGIGLLTGVDVAEVVARGEDGVRVWATVGLGAPIWAAADPGREADRPVRQADPARGVGRPARESDQPPGRQRVGTVNIVAFVPAPLTHAALVNAVATVTEAKAQALWELDLRATGTATDAVAVLCPSGGPAEPYGGPRSRWGAPLARAVRSAVRDGGALPGVPWSVREDHRR